MRILGVGIATLDVVNVVAEYPAEDAEVRAIEQRLVRGGNATNTLVALSQLGHRSSWAGMLADEPNARHITGDLARHDVDTRPCRIIRGGKVPTSYVTLSRATGSRTIVHFRDLPEFGIADFRALDLSRYDWIHFEGRTPELTRRMLDELRRRHPDTPCSVEVEKPRKGTDVLFHDVDVLLFSRQFARSRGFADGAEFLRAMQCAAQARRLFCAWGEHGAYGADREGSVRHCPAVAPPLVVDTLGAGDVFNAGVIHALLLGAATERALHTGCLLAGRKCGRQGLNELFDEQFSARDLVAPGGSPGTVDNGSKRG